ncbi:MAG: uracil phosphoribosyltransferase [Bacteroidales bacterium]|jgi:uracil phosphoribosyltransferase|nr:uracil phosphoribosyltransferase [Bacteroidales bacterium]MDN5329550.1 uracil phosphoribosyltransferase [Bacteroidales bacterium]
MEQIETKTSIFTEKSGSMVYVLGKQDSVLNQYIYEMRDAGIQQDSMRFRINMERAAMLFAFEISKKLKYRTVEVTTSLGSADVPIIDDKVVISSILRAGLPMHNGILHVFDHAENAFISAYRKYDRDGDFHIEMEYASVPDLDDKILILCDPMLATGASMVICYRELLNHGKPKHTHIVTLISSQEGIDYLRKNIPSEDYTLWTGAIDDELTAQAYIVPGLGDAGDLAFGKKTDSSH